MVSQHAAALRHLFFVAEELPKLPSNKGFADYWQLGAELERMQMGVRTTVACQPVSIVI